MNPGYTVRDLVSYFGFILGASCTFLALQNMGVESYWGKLAVAAVVGIGCGYVGDRLMLPEQDGDDE